MPPAYVQIIFTMQPGISEYYNCLKKNEVCVIVNKVSTFNFQGAGVGRHSNFKGNELAVITELQKVFRN